VGYKQVVSKLNIDYVFICIVTELSICIDEGSICIDDGSICIDDGSICIDDGSKRKYMS